MFLTFKNISLITEAKRTKLYVKTLFVSMEARTGGR